MRYKEPRVGRDTVTRRPRPRALWNGVIRMSIRLTGPSPSSARVRRIVPYLIAVLAVVSAALASLLQVDNEYALITKIVAEALPARHLEQHPLDDLIATRALDLLLESLDPDRSMFLATDIDSFQALRSRLDDALRAGDVEFGFELMELYKQRLRNRVAYVDTLLERGFDLTIDEEFGWDRKDMPWPANKEEQNELWRKKIKNIYISRVLADEERAEREDAKTATDNQAKKTRPPTDSPMAPTPEQEPDLNHEPQPKPSPEATAPGKPRGFRAFLRSLFGAEPAKMPSPLEPEDPVLPMPCPTPTAPDADAKKEMAKDETLPPAEFIKKRFKNRLTRMEDSAPEWTLQLYVSSFAEAYDPHTEYKSASAMEDWEIGMKLSLVGIGAYLTSEDGAAKIVRLIPGGPAEKDGRLQPGDRIIAVAQDTKDPVDTLHWPLSKVVRLIRGEKETRVVLTIIPASDPAGTTTKQVDIIRDVVKLKEQEAKADTYTIRTDQGAGLRIGVITLPAFYSDMRRMAKKQKEYKSSTRDVAALLAGTRTNRVAGIVLDLRNNGGGSLPESVSLTGLFIESGPVVRVKERKRTPTLYDNDPSIAYTGPLVILVNRNTASASEILAGALQDYGRAVLVGDSRTHGKGTVQTLIDLSRLKPRAPKRLGSLKITTASFHRISGGSTQLRGITPDIVLPSAYDRDDIGEANLHYPLPWSEVERAAYDPVADLSAIVPELKRRSEERRASNPRFSAHMQLLRRQEALREKAVVSLRIDTRRELREADRKLREQHAPAVPDRKDAPDGTPPASDLVLSEAIEILGDLVDLQTRTALGAVSDSVPTLTPDTEAP